MAWRGEVNKLTRKEESGKLLRSVQEKSLREGWVKNMITAGEVGYMANRGK